MSSLPLVRTWLLLSALASLAGWTLSAAGQLNRIGYVIAGAGGLVLFWLLRSSLMERGGRPLFYWNCVRRRFRRPLPAAFALLALLALVGGALYPPTNHTALTYRTPRVLQWLAEGHWFWIHTPDYRMNDRACGIEWLSAPLLLFTRSDRLLFLINFFPFLLLPGLVFSLLVRLRVAGRVAWQWMWILPTGYAFLLQAGSAGNDTFPTVYALAAVVFALLAQRTRRPVEVWFSVLAAALLTGAKASNLPLLLPWALALVPSLRLLLVRPLYSLGVLTLSAVVSFLPTAALNIYYCGDWSGLVLERVGMNMRNPLVGLWGNAFAFLLDNLVPPFFPMAKWWNQHGLELLPQPMVRALETHFEQGWHFLWELPTEDWAGLGFGVSVLWLAAGGTAICRRTPAAAGPVSGAGFGIWLRRAVIWSPWLALAAYCAKSGMATGARLISPYYPFLLPVLVGGAGQIWLIRQPLWRWLVWANSIAALMVLVVTPARPLWPARTVLSHLAKSHPGSRLLQRAQSTYEVYAIRSDPLAPVRELLPNGLRMVGFRADADDTDISFWRPFGERRVEHLLLTDTADQIRARHIEYAVVAELNLVTSGMTLSTWMQQTRADWVASTNAIIKVSEGAQRWHVVRFRP